MDIYCDELNITSIESTRILGYNIKHQVIGTWVRTKLNDQVVFKMLKGLVVNKHSYYLIDGKYTMIIYYDRDEKITHVECKHDNLVATMDHVKNKVVITENGNETYVYENGDISSADDSYDDMALDVRHINMLLPWTYYEELPLRCINLEKYNKMLSSYDFHIMQDQLYEAKQSDSPLIAADASVWNIFFEM